MHRLAQLDAEVVAVLAVHARLLIVRAQLGTRVVQPLAARPQLEVRVVEALVVHVQLLVAHARLGARVVDALADVRRAIHASNPRNPGRAHGAVRLQGLGLVPLQVVDGLEVPLSPLIPVVDALEIR
eukprot:5355584-Alexandrium_andersonii.AAC.1